MPRFTRAQIAARRRIAAGILVAVFLLIVGGCTIALTRALSTTTSHEARIADDSLMNVASTAPDAEAHTQLLQGYPLADGETIGIDVSGHQQHIDWTAVAADGYRFAYIKATEGMNFTDPRFATNWAEAQQAGLTVGAYHYFTLCSPGREQARDFLATVDVNDAHLPPALDLEFDGACDARPEASRAQAEINEFLAIVEAAWGRRMVIYSSSEWRAHYGIPQADARPDWLYSDLGRPEAEDWSVWQLRFDGRVSGIDVDVDIDVLRIEELRAHAAISEEERAHLTQRSQEE